MLRPLAALLLYSMSNITYVTKAAIHCFLLWQHFCFITIRYIKSNVTYVTKVTYLD